MATNNFGYWSDGLEGRAFDHHRRNGGWGICQQKLPQNRAFEQFFQMAGVCPGVCPGGGAPVCFHALPTSYERNYIVTGEYINKGDRNVRCFSQFKNGYVKVRAELGIFQASCFVSNLFELPGTYKLPRSSTQSIVVTYYQQYRQRAIITQSRSKTKKHSFNKHKNWIRRELGRVLSNFYAWDQTRKIFDEGYKSHSSHIPNISSNLVKTYSHVKVRAHS